MRKTILVSCCLALSFVAGTYCMTGRYQAWKQDNEYKKLAQKRQQLLALEGRDSHLVSLQNQLIRKPKEASLWFELAQYLLKSNQFDDAILAIKQSESLQGKTAESYAATAMVLYYQREKKTDKQIDELLDKALSLEPLQYSAIMLKAAIQFDNENYTLAINWWNKLLKSDDPNINRSEIIQAINVATIMQVME